MHYGHVADHDMFSPNNGKSVDFKLAGNNQHFTTSLVNQWFPDVPSMTFIPKQFHFHHGIFHKNESNGGSENTFNGEHMNVEMHIVHVNEDNSTQDKFIAAVTAVLFKSHPNVTEYGFADIFF
jgi:hypothetical protein